MRWKKDKSSSQIKRVIKNSFFKLLLFYGIDD